MKPQRWWCDLRRLPILSSSEQREAAERRAKILRGLSAGAMRAHRVDTVIEVATLRAGR
jgi:hypothetical protein